MSHCLQSEEEQATKDPLYKKKSKEEREALLTHGSRGAVGRCQRETEWNNSSIFNSWILMIELSKLECEG